MNLETSECDLKPIQSEMSVLSRPDGSAIFYQGDTIMIAAVYGPMEAKIQHMLIEKACVQAHFRPKAGVPRVADRLNESFIRNVCEIALMGSLYPRTVVSVIVQELQTCGGLISCAINAAYLAMLDAGVELNFLVGAVSCMIDEEDNLIVEPNHLELEKAKAIFSFAFNGSSGKIIASHSNGIFEEEQFIKAKDLSRAASAKIFAHYKNVIENRTNKS